MMGKFTRATLVILGMFTALPSMAQGVLKVGVVLPLTGPFSLAGLQALAGMQTWLATHDPVVAGRRIELVVRDDTANPAMARRLSQELVLNDKVSVLAGYGLTPMGAAAAPIATQARVPMLMTGVGARDITGMSPFAVRVFETLPQVAYALAQWAHAQGIARVVTLVADYTPGHDTEAGFVRAFRAQGGEILASLRTPVDTSDFSAYLQRARDARPQAVMVFQPEGPGGVMIRQYTSRGMLRDGIKFLGAGDIVPEEVIAHGDASFALGTNSAQAYTSVIDTPENLAFVSAYRRQADGAAPDIQSVAGYDAMNLIALALGTTGGNSDGDAMVAAMKGQSWLSPRGRVSIGATTRDITQDVYVREFRRVDGLVRNVIIGVYHQVPADPVGP